MLTTIESVTPMYCYVDVDENSVLKYQKLTSEKKRGTALSGKVPCYVGLANETGFPHEGHIDFIDNHIYPTTGTLQARGVLPNQSGMLIPGFYARLCIPGSDQYATLLVPDIAIGSDQNQRIVLVVNKDNVVEQRVVQPGALFGKLRSIVSGLTPDDRIIINGQMHARPGAVVMPTEQAINVDSAAFSNPGSAEKSTIPTTVTDSPGGTVNSNSDPSPSTEPASGNQP
jgi:RND family efflux transporter MFP subunit